MKKVYEKAVLEMLESGADHEAVLTGLSRTLTSRGHEKLHKSILEGVLEELVQMEVSDKALVTVAHKEGIEAHKAHIEKALTELRAEGEYETRIDSTVVGGFVARVQHRVLDQSYKQKLLTLYRSLS